MTFVERPKNLATFRCGLRKSPMLAYVNIKLPEKFSIPRSLVKLSAAIRDGRCSYEQRCTKGTFCLPMLFLPQSVCKFILQFLGGNINYVV